MRKIKKRNLANSIVVIVDGEDEKWYIEKVKEHYPSKSLREMSVKPEFPQKKKVEDVFVYHKVYGVIKVSMNIRSRRDVRKYMEDISSGKSTNLKNLTSNYHYHTITAEDSQVLDQIQEELAKRGFLAKLQDYEPVNFWGEKEN